MVAMNKENSGNEIVVVEQKTVTFQGSELLGVKASNGKIYVGVRWICEGIGLTKGQMQNERKRIREDLVLRKGERNFVPLTKGGQQEVNCIEINFLPLWLAKISITPNMQENQPDAAKKLVEYQLKAKDVLAEAFLQKTTSTVEDLIIMQAQSVKEVKARVDKMEGEVTESKKTLKTISETLLNEDEDWRRATNKMLNDAAERFDEAYEKIRNASYKKLEHRAGCKLKTRLANLKSRLTRNGATSQRLAQTNNMDVIENEPQLKQIYTAIVKEINVASLAGYDVG